MKNKKAISELAEGLLELSGQNSLPIDLSLIAKLESPHIIFQGVKFSGAFDGTLRIVNGRFVVLFNSNFGNEDNPRVRFTIAHELGHYFIDEHRRYYEAGNTHNSTFSFDPSQQEELEANHFAANLLMPKSIFEPLVLDSFPGWNTIEAMAQNARTSIISTALRYIELTDHPCVLIVIEGTMIKWFKPSKEMKGVYIERGPVPSYTHSYGVAYDGSVPPNAWDDTDADHWLTISGKRPKVQIKEWTYKHPYGQVLTLLWDKRGSLSRFMDE